MKRLLFCLLLLYGGLAQAQRRDTCYAGLYIRNIYDLKPEDYNFAANIWLWFDYRSPAFDPLKNVEVINAKDASYSDQYYASADRQMKLASESGKMTLIHDWQLKNYPFDTQVLTLQLEAGLDTSEMIMKAGSDNFKIYKNLNLPGWHIAGMQEKESIEGYDSDFGERRLHGHSHYSRITYQVKIARDCWGLFFKLLIGLYISFAVAFLVFFVPPLRDQRFGLSIGGLFAAVGNKYVMDNNIPSTTSFSFIDKIHDLTFFFILATLVLSVISLSLAEKNNEKGVRFDRNSAWIVFFLYIGTNLLLIIQANLT